MFFPLSHWVAHTHQGVSRAFDVAWEFDRRCACALLLREAEKQVAIDGFVEAIKSAAEF